MKTKKKNRKAAKRPQQRVVSRRGQLLCSVWSHPDSGQNLVIPGTRRETRKMAIDHIGAYTEISARKLKCVEEWWPDSKLKALPEYDG